VFGPPLQRDDWPNVFVVMPFSETLGAVFHDHIRPVSERLQLRCRRADDFFSTSSIVLEIWSAIFHAEIIIADCTRRNSNVFYEIGIAHTLGKETILISQSLEDVPFDLRQRRVILYEFSPRGMKAFEAALSKTLEAVQGQRRGAAS
jgi:hypothetical protein